MKGYARIPNDYLRDTRLSPGAIGVLANLMSHRADFEITAAGLATMMNASPRVIMGLLHELKEHGYLSGYERVHGPTGRFIWTPWKLETPRSQPSADSPEMVEPEMVEPEMVEPEMVTPEMVEPEMVLPGMVEPSHGASIHGEKGLKNNQSLQEQPTGRVDASHQQHGRRRRSDSEMLFLNGFWPDCLNAAKAVGRQPGSRADALMAWKKLTMAQQDSALEGIKRHLAACRGSPGVFTMPHGSTWLNKQRWLDDTPQLKGGTDGPRSEGLADLYDEYRREEER